jgi:hypothetical protein
MSSKENVLAEALKHDRGTPFDCYGFSVSNIGCQRIITS